VGLQLLRGHPDINARAILKDLSTAKLFGHCFWPLLEGLARPKKSQKSQLCRLSGAGPFFGHRRSNVFVSATTATVAETLAAANIIFSSLVLAKLKVIYARKNCQAEMPKSGKLYEIYIRTSRARMLGIWESESGESQTLPGLTVPIWGGCPCPLLAVSAAEPIKTSTAHYFACFLL